MTAMVVTASRCSFILAACLLALLGQSPSVATASLTQEEEDDSSSTRHGRHRHARHQQQTNQDFALYLLKALAPRHDCSKSKSMEADLWNGDSQEVARVDELSHSLPVSAEDDNVTESVTSHIRSKSETSKRSSLPPLRPAGASGTKITPEKRQAKIPNFCMWKVCLPPNYGSDEGVKRLRKNK